MEKFRRRIVDGPDIFPPEFWRLYLQFILTALVVYGRLVCVVVAWRRLITAGVLRQWRPQLEEVNHDVRECRVMIPGGVEQVELRAQTLHGTGNYLVLIDCFNAFNTVTGPRCLRGWPIACQCSRHLWPNDTVRDVADALFRMDSEKTRTIACASGVQQGCPMSNITL